LRSILVIVQARIDEAALPADLPLPPREPVGVDPRHHRHRDLVPERPGELGVPGQEVEEVHRRFRADRLVAVLLGDEQQAGFPGADRRGVERTGVEGSADDFERERVVLGVEPVQVRVELIVAAEGGKGQRVGQVAAALGLIRDVVGDEELRLVGFQVGFLGGFQDRRGQIGPVQALGVEPVRPGLHLVGVGITIEKVEVHRAHEVFRGAGRERVLELARGDEDVAQRGDRGRIFEIHELRQEIQARRIGRPAEEREVERLNDIVRIGGFRDGHLFVS
jgi:hypothetical protein